MFNINIVVFVDPNEYKNIYDKLSPRRFSIAINRAMKRFGEYARTELGKTVETWDTDVNFSLKYHLSADEKILEVSHDSLIYKFVDEGTPAHVIRVSTRKIRRAGGKRARLAFPESFQPKTMPGVLGSFEGGYSGEMLYPVYVNHPGAEPREFSSTVLINIEDNMEDTIYDELQKAWERQESI